MTIRTKDLFITDHALRRWRERVCQTDGRKEIKRRIAESVEYKLTEIPHEIRRCITSHKRGDTYFPCGNVLAVTNRHQYGWYVLTFLPLGGEADWSVYPTPDELQRDRDALVMTEDVRKMVGYWAKSISKRYGRRVDVNDLFQVGIKKLLSAARYWTDGQANSVWGYAKKSVISEMYKEAQKTCRDHLYLDHARVGETEQETYGRLCHEWLARVVGWGWVIDVRRDWDWR